MVKKGGLGRGLAALIPTKIKEDNKEVDIDKKNNTENLEVKSKEAKSKEAKSNTVKKNEAKNKTRKKQSTANKTTTNKKKQLDTSLNKETKEEKKTDQEQGLIDQLDIKLIEPNSKQPRKDFGEESLKELSESIKKYGILQPILVQKYTVPGHPPYRIVAGERRYRASILAGLDKVPVVIHNGDPGNTEMLSVIENIQREDLTPLEEALSYREIMNKKGLTQQELADALGKSRPYISNTIRLLQLDEASLKDLSEGKLTSSQARVLLAEKDLVKREKLRQLLIEGKINVNKAEKNKKKVKQKNAYLVDMEEKLMESLGTGVNILKRRKGWELQISCYSNEDLEKLTQILLGGER